MRFELEGYYLIEGPSRLVVVRGEAEVIGYRVTEGEALVIPAGRRFPARLSGSFYVLPSVGRVVDLDEGLYTSMEEAARLVSIYERPVIVGPSDSGKSTIAAWALNVSGGGFLLTMDIGQNEVHCPGFSSLAVASPPVLPGGSFRLVSSCFVGAFSPRGAEKRYLGCASILARLASSMEGKMVVDTDGWVSFPDGILLKAGLAGITGSDAVIAIGLEEKALDLLGSLVKAKLVEIPRPEIRAKDRGDRIRHRERLIARNLEGARTRVFKAGKTRILGLPLFKGTEISRDVLEQLYARAIYGERVGESIVVVARRTKGAQRREARHVRILQHGWERGLIVSIQGGGKPWLGIIEKIDYQKKTIHIYTSFDGNPECIIVGRERIDPRPYKGKIAW